MLASLAGTDIGPVELTDNAPCLEETLQQGFAEVWADGTLEALGPAGVAEVPEGIEFRLAEEEDDGMVDGSELSEASGEGNKGGEEATPINLPGPVATAQVPEGIEFRLAEGEDDGMADGSELSEASGEGDEGGEEATPINLPGPVPAIAEEPDPGPDPYDHTQSPEPGPHPFPHTALE